MIDPSQWAQMPWMQQTGSTGKPQVFTTLNPATAYTMSQRPATNDPVRTTQTAPGGQTAMAPNGIPMTQQQYDDWMQAAIEGAERLREESDRNFEIQLGQLNNQRQQIAISRSQQEANEWYNRQLVELSRAKLEEDRRQYDRTTGEAIRQFEIKQAELTRQFDLSTEEGRRQFNAAQAQQNAQFEATFGQRVKEFEQEYGFKREELAELTRRFDVTTEEGKRQFDANLSQRRAEFNTTSTGYTSTGQATLEREQFQNDALFKWTQQAIQLASQPQDWVKYKQFTSGVTDNAGAIPGLDWTQGGQQGNTAFAGEATPNSLGNVLGDMGVQQPGGAPTVTAPGAVTPPPQGGFSTQPINQPPSDPRVPGGSAVPPSILHGQTVVPGAPAQQNEAGPASGYAAALQAAQAQTAMTPGGGAAPAGWQFHGGQLIPQGVSFNAGQPEIVGYHGGQPVYKMLPGFTQPGVEADNYAAQPGMQPAGQTPAPAAPSQQPVTNWAQQAANMVPTNDQLLAKMTPQERQIWDTAQGFAKNPQQSAAGWYEQQDPMTKELYRGAAQAGGHDWGTVMSRYNRSRWGGSGSSMAA